MGRWQIAQMTSYLAGSTVTWQADLEHRAHDRGSARFRPSEEHEGPEGPWRLYCDPCSVPSRATPKTPSQDRTSLAPRRWMRRLRQATGQADEAIAAWVEAILSSPPPAEPRVPGGPSTRTQASPLAVRPHPNRDLKLLRAEASIDRMKLWLWSVVLVFCLDVAMPLSPGAWQPFKPDGQSVEVARLSVQAADAQLSPVPHRLAAPARAAPRIAPMRAVRREPTPSRPAVVLLMRSPQDASAALNSEDPA
jgi:hypothetical protein